MELSVNSGCKNEEVINRLLNKVLEISSQTVYSKFSLSIPIFENLLLIYESVYEQFKIEENYEAAFYILRKKEIFIDICLLKQYCSDGDSIFYYDKADGNFAEDINERLSILWFELQEKYSRECATNAERAEKNFNERWVETKSIQSLCNNAFNDMLKNHDIKITDLGNVKYDNLSFSGNFPILPSEIKNNTDSEDSTSDDEIMTSDEDEMSENDSESGSEMESSDDDSVNEDSEGNCLQIDNIEVDKNNSEIPQEDAEVNVNIDLEKFPLEALSPQNPEFQKNFNFKQDAKGVKNLRMDFESGESDDNSPLPNVRSNKPSIGKKIYEDLPSVQPASPCSDESNEPQPSTSKSSIQSSCNTSFKCEILKTPRGNDKIMFKGFMYVKLRTNSWRCDQRGKKTTNCNVIVKTKYENGCYYMVKGFERKHTHDPDFSRYEKQRADGKIKSYAALCGKPTGKIMKAISNEYSEDVLKKAGSKKAVKRKIQRVRQKNKNKVKQ